MLGDLYIQTTDQTTIQSQTYDLRTGTNPNYLYWLDCYKQWGVSLEKGALDALMTFRPNKEPVTNKNVTAQGAVYVAGGGLVDDRTVSVPFHIVAEDKADFLMKRAGFYEAIKGTPTKNLLVFKIANPVDVIYSMYYISCSQYTQFLDGMAKFVLTMYEAGSTDVDVAQPEPMPLYKDMEAYIAYLLNAYGKIASEQDVRNIIINYRTRNGL